MAVYRIDLWTDMDRPPELRERESDLKVWKFCKQKEELAFSQVSERASTSYSGEIDFRMSVLLETE